MCFSHIKCNIQVWMLSKLLTVWSGFQGAVRPEIQTFVSIGMDDHSEEEYKGKKMSKAWNTMTSKTFGSLEEIGRASKGKGDKGTHERGEPGKSDDLDAEWEELWRGVVSCARCLMGLWFGPGWRTNGKRNCKTIFKKDPNFVKAIHAPKAVFDYDY